MHPFGVWLFLLTKNDKCLQHDVMEVELAQVVSLIYYRGNSYLLLFPPKQHLLWAPVQQRINISEVQND